MAITVVQAGSAANNTSTNSDVVVTLGAPVTAGNALIVFAQSSYGSTPTYLGSTAIDGGLDAFTLLTQANDTTNLQFGGLWFCNSSAGGFTTVTVKFSGFAGGVGSGTMTVLEVSGLAASASDTGATHITAAGGSSSTNGDTSGSFTTSQAGELIIAGFFNDNGAGTTWTAGTSPITFTIPSGGSTSLGGANPHAVQYGIQGAAGAINPAITLGAAGGYLAIGWGFKPAAGGTQFTQSLTAATASFAGAVSKRTSKSSNLAAGNASWSATLPRTTSKGVTASMAAWAATLGRKISKGIAAATASFAGALSKLTGKVSNLSAAMASFAGALATTKVKLQALTASMAAFAGAITRQTGKSLTASNAAWAGTLARKTAKGITAATASFAGVLTRLTAKSISAGNAAWGGALATSKVKVQALTASMAAWAGGLSRQTQKGVTASMSAWAGTLTRRTAKTITAATAAWSAALNKFTAKSILSSMAAWLGILTPVKSGTLSGPFVGVTLIRTYPQMQGTFKTFASMDVAQIRVSPGMIVSGGFKVIGQD